MDIARRSDAISYGFDSQKKNFNHFNESIFEVPAKQVKCGAPLLRLAKSIYFIFSDLTANNNVHEIVLILTTFQI